LAAALKNRLEPLTNVRGSEIPFSALWLPEFGRLAEGMDRPLNAFLP
jgi:hypothetical protein